MVEEEFENRNRPSAQSEFRYMEAGGFESRGYVGDGIVCVD